MRRRPRAGSGGEAPRPPRPFGGHSVRIATALLWCLVAGAAVLGTLGFLARPPRHQGTTTAPESRPPTGFAELFVGAFVAAGEGTEESLRPFLADPPRLPGVTSGSLYAARTGAIDAELVAARYWSIRVAVEVLGRVGEAYEDLGIRVYQVAVFDGDSGAVAVALPSLVAMPTAPARPRLALRSADPPRADDELATAMSGFFTAYLCGDGDVERYVAPGAAITALQPTPLRSAKVLSLARSTAGQPVDEVLVEIEGEDAAGRRHRLAYGLVVARRTGRWEVQRLANPPLREPATAARPRTPAKEKQ